MNDLCSIELLQNAVARGLSAEEEMELHAHLEHCEACCTQMEQLAGGEAWQQEAAALLSADELDAAVPEPAVWSEVDFSVEHLDPSDDANVLGQLGGYDVLAIVGRGGMGVVLKAFDRELKRLVAIKALAPHLAHSSVARKRFAREAQAAAAVVNPHVIAIHHVQPTGRLPFLIMPLLTGESLAQRLKARGPLELTEVLRIGMQAATGLAAAHDQGLVHRDVKPANIFLEKGVERVVITDFGLARAADDVSMTRMGVVAGTPEYMSPEQARGEALDGRSDLFSLGCVLYEMATGVSPFRTDSTMATLRRIVDEQPAAMASLVPELPPWFCHIVERLLSKDPAKRFVSASEVSQLLEECLSHLQQPTSVPLPASMVPHAAGSRSIFNSPREGVLGMILPPLVEIVDGKQIVSWRGVCLTGLVVSALSVVGFLGFRFAFDVILGSTIDLFPGILLAATIPTALVLGRLLRTQLRPLQTAHAQDNAMKFMEGIEGEPRIPWYWAVALLIPIGTVVVGSTVAVLLLYYGGSQPLPPEARVLVAVAFPISVMASFFLWRWALQSLLMRLAHGQQPTSVPLPTSLVPHATGRSSIFNVTRKGVLAMLGTIGMTLLGLVLMQATEAPDISGQWTSDEWGTVVLEAKGPGHYEGTFSGSGKDKPAPRNDTLNGPGDGLPGAPGTRPVLRGGRVDGPDGSGESPKPLSDSDKGKSAAGNQSGIGGDRPTEDDPARLFDGGALLRPVPNIAIRKGESGTLRLKWSRVERRFNGTWGKGSDRSGTMSLRLVDKEIRGGWTTDEDVQLDSGTPLLGDLLWKRSVVTAGESIKPDNAQQDLQGTPYDGELPPAADTQAPQSNHNKRTSRTMTLFVREEDIQGSGFEPGDYVDVYQARKNDKHQPLNVFRFFRSVQILSMTPLADEAAASPPGKSIEVSVTADSYSVDVDLSIMEPLYAKSLQQGYLRWVVRPANGNARSVVEAYLAAALEGNIDGAVALATKDREASSDSTLHDLKTEFAGKKIKVPTAWTSEKNGRAIAVTDEVKIAEPNPDGRNTGRLVFHLVKSEDKWLVDDIDFDADKKAQEQVAKFKKENPDAKFLDANPKAVRTSFHDGNQKDGPAAKGSRLDKPLDRQNARAVVEAYIAAALAGRIEQAASLATDGPAVGNQIESLSRQLNVQRLVITSVYMNDPARPTRALATSEATKLTKKQPNGQRDGFLVLTLTMTNEGWSVTDIDFESEEGADDELKRFLEVSPNAISVPPQAVSEDAKVSGLDKPVDRQNARAVVEAYVAASIVGDAETARLLIGGHSPYDTMVFFQHLAQLPIRSVYVNDPANPTRALATSELWLFEEREQRDYFLAFRLSMSKTGWLLSDITWESEESADRELKKFREANPKATSVPPQPEAQGRAERVNPLIGHWKVVKLADMPVDQLAGATIVIDEHRVKMHVPSQKGPHPDWRYTLGANGEIDLVEAEDAKGESNSRAKYSLKGNTLYLALNAKKGDHPRPESATSEAPQKGVQYVVLELDEEATSREATKASDEGHGKREDNQQGPEQPALSKTLKQLQGKWQVIGQEYTATNEPITEVRSIWEFKDDRIIVWDDGQSGEMLIKVDESHSPVHVDLLFETEDESALGLLGVDGTQLIICLGKRQKTPPPESRPQKLRFVEGVWYMELRRLKRGAAIVPSKSKRQIQAQESARETSPVIPSQNRVDESKAPAVEANPKSTSVPPQTEKVSSGNVQLDKLDSAPARECRALIKRLDDDGEVQLAAAARERLAKRWKGITEQPAASFARQPTAKDPDVSGAFVQIQTELDGVWSDSKGTVEDWTNWITGKQADYRTDRLKLLFEAAQGYRKSDDAKSAVRVLRAGLNGHAIYDKELSTLIEMYWPITNDEPAKSLGSASHAGTLVNFLRELSATQQALGELDNAVETQSRLMLASFMLSWNQPSGEPTKSARDLWSLIRQQPQLLSPLFWFNVVHEKNPEHQFNLTGAGQKGNPLTYHHENLVAEPSLNFNELTITATTHGRKGILDCLRINSKGQFESVGVLTPSADGEADQVLSQTFKVPAETGMVQFMVAGEDFRVGEMKVKATFTKRDPAVKPVIDNPGTTSPNTRTMP